MQIRFNASLRSSMSTQLHESYILTRSSPLCHIGGKSSCKDFGLGIEVSFLPGLQPCILRLCFVWSWVSSGRRTLQQSSFLPFSCFVLHSCSPLPVFLQLRKILGKCKNFLCILLFPFFLRSVRFCHLWLHAESGGQNINMLISEPWAIFLTVGREHSPLAVP